MSKNTGTSELINYFDLGANGDVGIAGSLDINTIANATTDTDTFLVSDTGIIKYRTGAQLLSDIGAAPAVAGGYVPYTGAGANVDLGVYNLTASAIIANGSGSNSGIVHLESNAIHSLVNGYGSIASGTTNQFNLYQTTGAGVFRGAILSLNSITASATRTFTLPDADGTIALTSSLSGYLPLTGGTLTGALNGTSATFSGDLIAASATLNTPAAGISMLLTGRSSDSLNQIRFNSNVGALNNFITSLPASLIIASQGSTPIEFITNNAVSSTPRMSISGAGAVTLTGALNGTSASFTGAVTSDDLILTAGTLFGAGNTGFSNRLSDTTLYLQMPATGFNITDNALNTRFILASTGAATFSSSVTATGGYYYGQTINSFVRLDNSIGSQIGYLNYADITYDSDGHTFYIGTGTSGSRTPKMRIRGTGQVGIGTTTPERQFVISNGGAEGIEFTNVGSQIYEVITYNRSTSAYTPLQFESSIFTFNRGNFLIGTPTDSGYKLDVNGSGRFGTIMLADRISLSSYASLYGKKVVKADNVSSFTFNLSTIFPEMSAAFSTNVVGCFGMYTIFRGGQGETGIFSISRNGSSWSSPSFSIQTATGAYSLSTVTASGTSITLVFNTNVYVMVEVTAMIE